MPFASDQRDPVANQPRCSSAVGDSYSTSIDVYDSLGNSHVVTVDFTKSAANAWGYTMSVPGADVGINPPRTGPPPKLIQWEMLVTPNPEWLPV